MYVSKEYRLIYLANPKTASRATAGALAREIPDMERFGPHHNLPEPKSLASLEIDLADYIVVTGVRFHPDALISWHFLYQHGVPWGIEFIDKLHKGLLGDYFPRDDRLFWLMCQYATHVIHMENLAPELNAVLAERDLGPISIPVVHASEQRNGRPWQDFFNPAERLYVEDRYGEEMAEYGYNWED